MSDTLQFPFGLLWQEPPTPVGRQPDARRRRHLLSLARQAGVKPATTVCALERANEALDDVRA